MRSCLSTRLESAFTYATTRWVAAPGLALATAVLAAITSTADAQQWTFLDAPFESGRMTAFDSQRSRLVWFGMDGGTWELAGSELLRRQPDVSPPARSNAVMVYDVARAHTLLFGGDDGNGTTFGDTWAWDGARWTPLTAGPQPGPRIMAGAAYDLLRQRVVLHGGRQMGVTSYFDTWEHDGTQWILRDPGPSAGASDMAMAYDVARGVTVLVELRSINTPVWTWTWDGVTWRQVSTLGPQRGTEASLAYDLGRARIVMCGSVGDPNLWEWNGASWQARSAPNLPIRAQPAVYYDPARGRVAFVGGYRYEGGYSIGLSTDAWEWDGVAVQRLRPERGPPGWLFPVVCADPARGEIVAFGGGRFGQPVPPETWTWDGNAWTQRQPTAQTTARSGMALAWDPVRQQVLLFGGETAAGTYSAELWGWNGLDWALLDPGTGLTPRRDAHVAFDASRGVLVMVGGSNFGALNDVWEWNGATWAQHGSVPSSLWNRYGGTMTFDPTRNRILWYGGSYTFWNSDTWAYDGTTWTLLTVAAQPGRLRFPQLVPDPARSRVLLVGTTDPSTPFTLPTTFELYALANGTWTRLALTPISRFPGSLVMDPLHGRLVGVRAPGLTEWSENLAQASSFGLGCGTPAPRLALRSRPRIGARSFGLEAHGPGGYPTLFGFADAPGSLVLGNGCTLFLGGTMVLDFLMLPGGNGFTEVVVPIPETTTLRGITLFAQAAVLDSAAQDGFRLTQAIQFTVGD